MKFRKVFLSITFVLSFASFIYVLIFWNKEAFKNLFLLPLAFLIFVPMLNYRVFLRSNSVFTFCFISFAALRYIVLPVLMTITEYDYGRASYPPSIDSTISAIYMMCFELMACSIAMVFMTRKNKKRSIKFNYDIRSNQNVTYSLFIIASIVLLIVVPSAFENLNFFTAADDLERSFNSNGFIYAATLYCALTAKSLVFCLGSLFLSRRYNSSRNVLYFVLNLGLCVINVGVYYGASRLSIVTTAIASIILLFLIYDNKKMVIYSSAIIGFVVIFVFTSLTLARSIVYGSNLNSITDLVSVYCGGPYNVAIAIETPLYYPEASSIETFIYDFTRPIIGLGYLVDNPNSHYSVYYFNYRMTQGRYFSQILPMVGQSYIYFGFLFSPLFSVLWFIIGSIMEKHAINSKRPELYYFLLFNTLRISTFMGQSSINQINSLSMNLLLFVVVYYVNKKVRVDDYVRTSNINRVLKP